MCAVLLPPGDNPIAVNNNNNRLTEKLRETGSVLDAEKCGRLSKLNGKKLRDISDTMLRSPSKSLRKLAQEKDIGLATAHKAVREKLNLFPYKVTAVQVLKPACIDARGHHFQRLL
jgi:hypothetical protein